MPDMLPASASTTALREIHDCDGATSEERGIAELQLTDFWHDPHPALSPDPSRQ
jgi:hypothetical protein